MKNFFKKFGVLLLGLVTLVSCNSVSRYTSKIEFQSLDELKTVLANASVKEGEPTGTYIFNGASNVNGLTPDLITTYFYTSCTKEQQTTMTKENLVVDTERFVVETTLTYKQSNAEDVKYVLNSRDAFATDVLQQHILQGHPLGIFKATKPLYEDYPSCYIIGCYVRDKDSNKITQKDDFIYVNSTQSDETTKAIAQKLMFNLQYVKIGK